MREQVPRPHGEVTRGHGVGRCRVPWAGGAHVGAWCAYRGVHEQACPCPPSYDGLVQHQRGPAPAWSLLIWLDHETEWMAPKHGRPGRPETFSDAAIQFGLSIKVLLWLPPVMQEVSDLIGV